MTFMANVIDRASVSAEEALRFDSDEMAELERLFGDEERLMLALRQRWMTTLTAKLDQAAHEGVPAAQVRARLASAQPGLRALLDAALRATRPSGVRALFVERPDPVPGPSTTPHPPSGGEPPTGRRDPS